MRTHIRTPALLLCSSVLLFGSVASAQGPATLPADGIDVLARGPVHEAFAQPVDDKAQASPPVPKEPPPAIEELPPDQKPEGENVQWIPGYWQWDDDRGEFIWISGLWRAVPPGRQWVPGRYVRVESGWQWMSGYWQASEQADVQVLPPPPPPLEAIPAEPPPADDSVLVPGCWVYRQTRYVWRPSYYLAYRPGWIWVPAHYVWTPLGYVFVDGYWDYSLARRGLLFAPIGFERRLWLSPGFAYTPSYVVSIDFLPTALFVRPAWCHYYFGDYFAGRYARLGFTPWIDYRIGRHAYDPLYSYYRAGHASRPWARDLAVVYADRARGHLAPLPRTWTQQAAPVRGGSNVTVLAPLAQLNSERAKLVRVNSQDRTRALRQIEQVREVSRQRGEAAARLPATPPRAGDPPRKLKLDPPRPAPVSAKVEPPPPPVKQQPDLTRHVPGRPQETLRKDPKPPPGPKHEPPPPVKKNPAPPPAVKKDVPPPQEASRPARILRDTPPAPQQPMKRDRTPPPKPEPPPPVRKDLSPPPAVRRDAPPPPKQEAPRPAPIRREPPPPPPGKREVSPPPRHELPSPPKGHKDSPPPASVQHKSSPPPSPPKSSPPPSRPAPPSARPDKDPAHKK